MPSVSDLTVAVFTMKFGWPLLLWSALLQAAVLRVSTSMVCEPGVDRKTAASSSAKAMLQRNLLCQYDTRIQPQKNMNISVELFLRRARVVDRTLEVKVLTNLYWQDPFLTWDPAQYDGVKEIQISTDKIWTPTIGTIVTLPWLRDGAAQEGLWPAVCHVMSDGRVMCTSAMDMGGPCLMSYLYWPHIQASCIAFVGLDFRVEKGVNMEFYNEAVEAELLNYVPDNDWIVTHVDRDSDIYGYENIALTYDFKLQSRGAVILTALVGPGVVISVLLLGSFFLPTNSHERLGLCCCGTLGTVIASSLLFEKLPTFDGPNPIVVTTYSGLLALSAIAILMTLLLGILVPQSSKPPAPPKWLYTIQSWLTNSTVGKILLKILIMPPQKQPGAFTGTENTNEESIDPPQHADDAAAHHLTSGPHKIWNFITSFLNRSMFVVFLTACIVLCFHLLHDVVMEEDTDILYPH